jgi:DNA primase
LVEGYFDVIALSIAGYHVGVASCGTSLTPEHCTQLKRYTDDILFLFDADTA